MVEPCMMNEWVIDYKVEVRNHERFKEEEEGAG
jgi:hypothetical protein